MPDQPDTKPKPKIKVFNVARHALRELGQQTTADKLYSRFTFAYLQDGARTPEQFIRAMRTELSTIRGMIIKQGAKPERFKLNLESIIPHETKNNIFIISLLRVNLKINAALYTNEPFTESGKAEIENAADPVDIFSED